MFDLNDYDNGRFYKFSHKGAELYYFDMYRIEEDGTETLEETDHALTFREVTKLDGGREFLNAEAKNDD